MSAYVSGSRLGSGSGNGDGRASTIRCFRFCSAGQEAGLIIVVLVIFGHIIWQLCCNCTIPFCFMFVMIFFSVVVVISAHTNARSSWAFFNTLFYLCAQIRHGTKKRAKKTKKKEKREIKKRENQET